MDSADIQRNSVGKACVCQTVMQKPNVDNMGNLVLRLAQ
jgi:hypothetical protein